MIGLTLQIELVPKKADKLVHFESVRPCVFSEGGQIKVAEKILPGQIESRRNCRGVLGIVPFGGLFRTVPELLFEKKQLMPDIEQLLLKLQSLTKQ